MLVVVLALMLRELWTFDAGAHVWATPSASSGHVYVGTATGDLYALDERTGLRIWEATLGANPNTFYGYSRGIVGGIATQYDVVYAASGSCVAAGFDANDGREIWRTHICSVARNDDVYAAPVVVDGLVLIGIDMIGDQPTDRGREIALDATSGKIHWTLFPQRYSGTGTGISTRPAVDAADDLAFIGTGNPTPMNNPPTGSDPGSDSIIAFEPATGRERWSFGPVHPHDTQDLDLFASPNLFTVHGRDAVGDIDKDGTYYTVDALSGRLIWQTRIPFPGYVAAVGTPAQGDGMLFVPLYGPIGITPLHAAGSLVALDQSSGQQRWRYRGGGMYEAPVYSGGVVYVTETDGWLVGLDARSGKLLARLHVGGELIGHGAAVDGDILLVVHDTKVTAYRTSCC